jgi:hypothetical protein
MNRRRIFGFLAVTPMFAATVAKAQIIVTESAELTIGQLSASDLLAPEIEATRLSSEGRR